MGLVDVRGALLTPMKTPRRRHSGVSLGRFISFKNPPLPPFFKVGLAETPQQRLWGIENLNKSLETVEGSCNISPREPLLFPFVLYDAGGC
jgi:hypothetical protein